MSKKAEARFWSWLQPIITSFADVQRHEDKYSVGIPDLSYGVNGVNGWIELKACDKWPTGGLPLFTNKQSNWLTDRGKTGGHCFILVRISSVILIFPWEKATVLLEKVSKEDALEVWESDFDIKEFANILEFE